MKTFGLFTMAFMTALSCSAAPPTLEDISPHLSTNTPIIWSAPANDLPKGFWIYKKLPSVFSATVISNAVVLASFQNKGFPQPSTNRIVIWADHIEGDPQPGYFEITPDSGEMSYNVGSRALNSSQGIPSDEIVVKRAWNYVFQLGIDRKQLAQKSVSDHAIFLPRLIDGIEVYDESEGFSLQFGDHGEIRFFSIAWPNLERDQYSPIASPQQIVYCIRAFKTPVFPNGDEPDFFARVNSLAKAKTFTITKITPYYGEGAYGETPTNNEPPKFVTPIAELEAVADFGNSNATVRLFSPILSSQAIKLLGNNAN